MRVFLLLLVFVCTNVAAQKVYNSHRRDRSVKIIYDNDVLFISDQYYTSGGELGYSYLADTTKFISKLFRQSFDRRIIIDFNYGHKIFNSKKIQETDLILRDRPFAGYHYGNAIIGNFPSMNAKNEYMIEFGIVGPKSGIGNFQKWWHRTGNIVTPKGWEEEIQNEVIVNLGFSRFQGVNVSKRTEIVSESNFIVGNGISSIYEQISVRIGKINPISNTTFTNSRIKEGLPQIGENDNNQEELFFFFGFRGDYVNHNIFIEGSLFNDNSPLVRESEDFIFSQTWGMMYSNYYTTIKIEFYRLSPEVVGGDNHRFVRLELGLRF